jgi:hypothetical protein
MDPHEHDEKLEAFLRQFQPAKPAALPEALPQPGPFSVRPFVWAAAAVLLVCLGIGLAMRNLVPAPADDPVAASDARLMDEIAAHLSRPIAEPMTPLLATYPPDGPTSLVTRDGPPRLSTTTLPRKPRETK